jgi:hypothetical protein
MKSSTKKSFKSNSKVWPGKDMPVPSLPRRIGSQLNLKAGDSIQPGRITLDFPIVPTRVTLSGGTASCTQVISVNPSLIENFSSFAACFKEYCIVGMKGELRCIDGPNTQGVNATGLLLCALDEKSSAASTFQTIQDQAHIEALVPYSADMVTHTIDWKPQDFEDLLWLFTTNLTTTPVYVKFYADVANTFGGGTAASASFAFTGALRVDFRGYT